MRILLAMDDSPCSQAAMRNVLTQFRTQDAEIRVLSVVEPISVYISADAFPHFTPQVAEIEEERKIASNRSGETALPVEFGRRVQGQ